MCEGFLEIQIPFPIVSKFTGCVTDLLQDINGAICVQLSAKSYSNSGPSLHRQSMLMGMPIVNTLFWPFHPQPLVIC